MVVTVTATVATENLAIAVVLGVVTGELLFASSNDLYTLFNYAEDPQHILIVFSESHLWDASTIASLDSVTQKYGHYNKDLEIKGLNVPSRAMRARMSGRIES